MRRARLAAAVLLAVVAALNYLDRVTLTTMRTSLMEAIPMTDTKFGLLTSVFLWLYAAMSPLGGFLADRVSRAKVIIGSLFLWSAATWLTAHATTSNELLVTRAFMGISEACYIPAALALCASQGLAIPPFETSYFLSRETFVPTPGAGMARWRERLFAAMSRNAGSVASYFRLPDNAVVELGTRVQI